MKNFKPDYLLIGSSKCGTSSITYLLSQHPDIFMSTPREPEFFARDEVYQKGLSWYESLFANSGQKKIRGEGSNLYTMKEVFPNTVSRIASYVPEAKLIYCVRNPFHRIESYWLELRAHGGDKVHYDFNTAVSSNQDWLLDPTNYWQQIGAFRKFFSDTQIHVIFLEDFIENPTLTMKKCFEFLNVDPDKSLVDSNLHLGSTSGRSIQRKFSSQLRTNPFYRSMVKLVPQNVRNSMRSKLFFTQNYKKPDWKPETKKWVTDTLENDLATFLEFYGKSRSFWKHHYNV
jgi:Sulfotransferase domain